MIEHVSAVLSCSFNDIDHAAVPLSSAFKNTNTRFRGFHDIISVQMDAVHAFRVRFQAELAS